MARRTTSERILEAALVEFDKKGYEAVTIAAIRRRARVSNGSFFHAFPSKEALADAVFIASLDAYHRALTGVVSRDTKPAAGVAALVRTHVSWVIGNKAKARFMFLQGSSAKTTSLRSAQSAANENFRRGLASWYQPHIRRGGLHPLPPEVLVSQIIGPVQMFCRAWLSGRNPERPDRHLPLLIAGAVRAVVPAKPR
ncbi:MAG: TetR/AcrR family transcriptional regulator [Alphaproteobacteria bacterium]|nr:TetR/AcrR family transcriptional regulator [Alphaproteobacteria bacterium]